MPTISSDGPTPCPVNLEAALDRCGGDAEFLNEMLNEFLQLSRRQLSQITQAIEVSDGQILAREAHSVKGAAASLGAESISRTALELELCGKEQHLENARQLLQKLDQQIQLLDNFVKQGTVVSDKK